MLAGTLQVEWKSVHPEVADVELLEGKATLVAHSAGTTTLVATGGALVQEVPVEVKP